MGNQLGIQLDSNRFAVSQETIYDLMNSKMKSVGEAFFHDADKNKDGSLTHTEFKNVVQAHDCIRSLIQMRFSEASTLPGWQDIYAEVGVNGADKFTPSEVVGSSCASFMGSFEWPSSTTKCN